jgi:UDP-N-acetylmuramoyl-L-alanyl-D-glutamate--2,6-diaminopimelate ligase
MNVPATSVWRPLKAVLGGLVDVPDRLEVCDITQDSRTVVPGAAFLACQGRTHHGLQFVDDAVAAGARVILWEPGPGVNAPALDPTVLVRPVPKLHAQLGFIADRFFDAPSASVTVAGITGTNGKTTCAWLLAQALSLCGRRAAYIGTLGAGTPGHLAALANTTPDALTLQRLLAELRASGIDAVAMEVSSHALDQERCAGLRIHTAVFTNLTRDHLDYHGNMQSYGTAKARLFDWPTLAVRVINIDDAFGVELARQQSGPLHDAARAPLFLTSLHRREWLDGSAEFVRTSAIRLSAAGIELQIESSRGAMPLSSRLIGDFNVENLLTVLAVLLAWDIPLSDACSALACCTAPPGRMQPEGGGGQPLVLIDYAHTPDALTKALQAARAHCDGRLWCVFGCGGERDQGKRAVMGRIAAQLADRLVVTDDNPRREDPARIVASIMEGILAAGAAARAQVNHDRAAAIRTAIVQSASGDVVLIAGKGHEDYQIVGSEYRIFSDAATARKILAERSAA